MISKVYIALGANLGDRAANLHLAVEYISRLPDTVIRAESDIYETDPVGYTEQDTFLNMAVAVDTAFEPLRLLKELLKIEGMLQRKREIRWGPRTIDIDILLYEDRTIDLPELTIPHPRMLERAFVLVPLRDIYPSGQINGRDMDQLIDKCTDKGGIRLYRQSKTKN